MNAAKDETTGEETTRAVLQRAVQIEFRNGKVYDAFASLFQGYDESVVGIFKEMADEERQHEKKLLERFLERFGEFPGEATEPKEVIESPDLEDAEALVFDSMTLEEALTTGLRAEKQARAFYQGQVPRTSDPGLRLLYQELSEFEEDHVRTIETKLAELRKAKTS